MARRYVSSAERRTHDREIRRLAANRKVGHDHAYLILFGGWIPWAVGFVLVAIGCAWMWFHVDHRTIAFAAASLGFFALLAYVASTYAVTGVQARQMALATGRPPRPMWWHGVLVAGVALLALAYVAMPR
jgi:uncharacterized membrane protein